MKRVMAFVLAGGRTRGLSVLAQPRSVAAVPFAGKFRLIDFTLSNCINSELYSVAILAQYAPLSLGAYVGRGEPWDLDRRGGGVTILQPYARQDGARWYEGTADALRQNLDVLENSKADYVFVLSTDLIYKLDYSWVLSEHVKSEAKATLVVGSPPYGEVNRFGMVDLDDDGHILRFEEKPERTEASYAFTGVYLLNADFLKDELLKTEGANLILDVLLPLVAKDDRIRAYRHTEYWEDVGGGIPEYFRAHQRLLDDDPQPQLYDENWPIYARSEEMFPAVFTETAEVEASLVANGATVKGRVERSIISPGVEIEAGAVVRDAILLNGTRVQPGAVVERAIVDKNVTIGPAARVGRRDGGAGEGDPHLDGIAVIGKWAKIPEGGVVGPGCVVPMGDPRPEFPERMGDAG